MIGEEERDAAVAFSEWLDACPHHLTGRDQLVEIGWLVPLESRRQDLVLQDGGRQRQPLQRFDDIEQSIEAARGRVTPCHWVSSRPSTGNSTGSTSCRSFASERRRMAVRTELSHHSWCWPPGRNSPSSSRPSACSAFSARSAVDRPSAKRAAISSVVNGPCVRAYRETRSRSACGCAREQRVGQALRQGHAERVAVARRVLDGDEPRLAGDAQPHRPPGTHQPIAGVRRHIGVTRSRSSAAERSPMRSSRSWTPSSVRAR